MLRPPTPLGAIREDGGRLAVLTYIHSKHYREDYTLFPASDRRSAEDALAWL